MSDGGDARSQHENHDTPLNFVLTNGKHAVAQMLLEHGVDANAQPLYQEKG